MKKTLSSIALLLTMCAANSQKCEFEKNERDQFTGKRIILARSPLFTEFTKRADLVFAFSQDSFKVVLSYVEATPQVLEADISSELWLSLSDETVIKLNILKPSLGKIKTPYKGTAECVLSPNYFISRDQLEKLISNQISSFRITLKQGIIQKIIEPKQQKKIVQAVNCLLQELN